MGGNESKSRRPPERDRDKDVHVLLLGMTGAGKTKLLNFICRVMEIKRLIAQNKLPNQPLPDCNKQECESGAPVTESQTDAATTYKLPNILPNRRAVRILDCPGFGDTRGPAKDSDHCDIIVEEICNQRWLNAIVLVVKGTDQRVPAQLRYVLMRITSVLPITILSQVIVVYTHCDITTCIFEHTELGRIFGGPIPKDRVLYMDNPFALMCNLDKPEVRSNERLLKRLKKKVVDAFEDSVEDVEEIMAKVSVFPRVSSSYFQELHMARKKLEKEGVMMKERLQDIDREKQELEKLEGAIKQGGDAIALIEESIKAGEWMWRKKDSIGRHNMTCQKPGCHINCHVGCLMPVCEKGTDLRKCEVFSDVRERKVRWSVGDAQRFLDKLENKEFNVTDASAEGDGGKTIKTHNRLRVKPTEILTLESGETLYGKKDKLISGGSDEYWVWSKNYYTSTIFLDPENLEELAKKSNSNWTASFGKQLKHFEPFNLSVKDCSHMEAGNKMTCSACKHPLDMHAYNDYENVHEFVYKLSEDQRKSKTKELERLRKGERDLTSKTSKAQEVQEKAVREKQQAVREMSVKLEAFNRLSTTKNFEAFLLKQIEALDTQLQLLLEDTDMTQGFKDIQKANILEYKEVLVNTQHALEETKKTGQVVVKPTDIPDDATMQASMDSELPKDNVEVVELDDVEVSDC